MADLNPDSEKLVSGAFVEPSLSDAEPGTTYQFERLGYFAPDPDSAPDRPVFNRTLTLKDTLGQIAGRAALLGRAASIIYY